MPIWAKVALSAMGVASLSGFFAVVFKIYFGKNYKNLNIGEENL